MSRSGGIYQRLDKVEDELKTENSYRQGSKLKKIWPDILIFVWQVN